MASAKRTSKKHSDSSSHALPESPPLFIDRCAWSHRLGDALAQAGIPFVAHHTLFEHDTPDEVWLKHAGDARWIVITRDKRIRRRPNEIRAFVENRVIAFFLAAGDASAQDTALLVTKLHRRIVGRARSAHPPAMFSITMGGVISPIRMR